MKWCFPPTDNTIQPLAFRIGDLFELTVDDNNRSQATDKPQMFHKQKVGCVFLATQLTQSKTRRMP